MVGLQSCCSGPVNMADIIIHEKRLSSFNTYLFKDLAENSLVPFCFAAMKAVEHYIKILKKIILRIQQVEPVGLVAQDCSYEPLLF